MSAIAVILLRADRGEVYRHQVEAMLGAMHHRGPDGVGAWTGGRVGMGHLLLATGGATVSECQPLVRGDHTIVADCRLDNRDGLLHAVGCAGHAAVSDAELVLRAYVRWGERSLEHLRGDFAFAIWDGRQRRLFCGRDHFGVKPLYHWGSDGLFVASTEIKALLSLPQVPRELDEQTAIDHLTGSFDDPEITYWKGIRRLPAACRLTVGEIESSRVCRYWSLDPRREIRMGSDREYAEALRDVFVRAVRRRIRGGEAAGAALSGGLDSTSIACTAALLTDPHRIPTFSLVFEHLPAVDERRWIVRALERGGLEPHWIAGDGLDLFAAIDELLLHLDGPFYGPNLYLHWAMYEAANRAGVRVFLDGLDGDGTISHGLGYPRELFTRGRWIAAGREVRALAQRNGRSSWQQARRLLPLPTGIAALRERRASLRAGRPLPDPADPFGLLAPGVRHLARLPRDLGAVGFFARERDAHLHRMSWPIHAAVLEMADHAAAAHGVEPRYPFYDVELVEFCLALPGDQKLRGGWTRWVMRQAMAEILPTAVRWRPDKSNLSPVLAHALRRAPDRVDALIAEPERLSPFVNIAVLQNSWSRLRRGPHPRPADVMAVWLPLVLDHGIQHMRQLAPAAAR